MRLPESIARFLDSAGRVSTVQWLLVEVGAGAILTTLLRLVTRLSWPWIVLLGFGVTALGLAAFLKIQQERKAKATPPKIDPPPDPTFRCQAIILPDGRVDIALRSSHFPDPLHDLILSKQQLRRGFEASCVVKMPEGRGISLTPLRTSCMVGHTVTWTYPDDFDARISPDAPPFPLVTGPYTVKCEWRNPRGSRGLGSSLKEAARCGFNIVKTIPASSPETKRTALAMKVLRLAIDVLKWHINFPTAMREADGDTPGERKPRAERDERVRQELPPFIERFRELWPEVEALGIVAPDVYWEPETLQQAEAWEGRFLRGLVAELVHRG